MGGAPGRFCSHAQTYSISFTFISAPSSSPIQTPFPFPFNHPTLLPASSLPSQPHPELHQLHFCPSLSQWLQCRGSPPTRTCMYTLARSRGAVPVRDTAPAMAPESRNFHKAPALSTSRTSMGTINCSPVSSTCRTDPAAAHDQSGWNQTHLQNPLLVKGPPWSSRLQDEILGLLGGKWTMYRGGQYGFLPQKFWLEILGDLYLTCCDVRCSRSFLLTCPNTYPYT